MQPDFTLQIKKQTDQELTDIYNNPWNYNPTFVKLVEEELRLRNINLGAYTEVREQNEEVRKQQLQQGKKGSPLYILLSFVLALLGGLLGIYAGYIYSQSKIKDNNEEQYYVYDEQTRHWGKIIMWLGIGVFLFALLVRSSNL
ncbi:hypothetical protein ACLOAU_24485 [Niabella sp. CJ426]|uniref:hypothetical protein n=1 Tax=Niabella sp. CJ426 TaxID=3393740 RepID=UPI003D02DDB2